MQMTRNLALLVVTAGLLSGCGGGGGGGGSSPPPQTPNAAPVAEAGPLQTVDPGVLVQLDGSASSDSDGTITDWLWQQTSGPELDLETPDLPTASFTAPDITQGAELGFTLTVTDDDGGSATDSVTVTVRATEIIERVQVSGVIVPATGHQRDGDTNDPGNVLTSNNFVDEAQAISNPTTLGGYVNQPGTGAEGNSSLLGDPDDYFQVELLRGQRITLLVADFQQADADLYLLDPAGTILDFSIDVGEIEALTVPADGRYIINVFAFAGATNYTLAVGNAGQALATEEPVEIVPVSYTHLRAHET